MFPVAFDEVKENYKDYVIDWAIHVKVYKPGCSCGLHRDKRNDRHVEETRDVDFVIMPCSVCKHKYCSAGYEISYDLGEDLMQNEGVVVCPHPRC